MCNNEGSIIVDVVVINKVQKEKHTYGGGLIGRYVIVKLNRGWAAIKDPSHHLYWWKLLGKVGNRVVHLFVAQLDLVDTIDEGHSCSVTDHF